MVCLYEKTLCSSSWLFPSSFGLHNVWNPRHFSTNPRACRSIHSGPRQLRCSSWVVKLHGFGLDVSVVQIWWKKHEVLRFCCLFSISCRCLNRRYFKQWKPKGFRSSLGKCCGILHRSSEVWCAKDEQTDTIYAVKNICEATCPTQCREWNDTKCMEWLWNQLSVSSAMCKTFGFSPRFAAWNWGPQHLGSEPQGVWGQRSHPLDATPMSLGTCFAKDRCSVLNQERGWNNEIKRLVEMDVTKEFEFESHFITNFRNKQKAKVLTISAKSLRFGSAVFSAQFSRCWALPSGHGILPWRNPHTTHPTDTVDCRWGRCPVYQVVGKKWKKSDRNVVVQRFRVQV